MKRKTIIISCIVILIISILVYKLINKKEIGNEDKVTNVSDIELDISDNLIEEVDFSSLEVKEIKLSNSLKITNGGVYKLTGTINNGWIYVDTKENVKLILDNVNITNETGPAIMIENANIIYVELAQNSINYLKDGDSYEVEEETNGTLFSKDDLVLLGEGKLIIDANYADGIVGKDNLKIQNGTYEIISKDEGIRGKDSLIIENGTFNINSGGDAIKSTNDTDDSLGYIIINNGIFDIIATNDAIQAETDLLIKNGTFKLETGNGSSNSSTTNNSWGMWGYGNNNVIETESAKGLKATKNIIIENGEFNIDSSDDSIHSNEYVGISSGTFIIKSGDDGIHADNELIIDGGSITIEKSYEGIEAESITINNGEIKIIASDDGINAAGGNDGSSMNGRPGMNNFEGSGNSDIKINDGNIYIDASGDGIDANGSIYLTGGTVIVNGPTNSGNGALDYDREFKVTGGTLIASGSSGMAQSASSSSTQNVVMINFSNAISKGEIISIIDEDNNEIITYEASKNYQNIVISTPNIKTNFTYKIYTNIETTNQNNNGLYEIGGYINGDEYTNFTVSNILTSVGSGGGINQGGMNQGMRPGMKNPITR